MIAYKNTFEEIVEGSENNEAEHLTFKINDTMFILKKKFNKLHDIILSYSSDENKDELIEIKIPNLSHHDTIIYHYDNKEEEEEKNKYTPISLDILNKISNQKPKIKPDVLHSNYDGRYDKDARYNKFTKNPFYYIDYNKEDYFNNNITIKSQIIKIPLLTDENKEIKKSYISLEQLQLLFDGYDILIPDFIVDDMIQIAEKFEIRDLIDKIRPLK